MTERHTHIIGAGLAGLQSALQLTLAGLPVTLYEAAPFAGGRCRSFMDRELGCRLDNGNHMVLSGNVAVQDYLYLTNALDTMERSPKAVFPFMDAQTGKKWEIRMNDGSFPWWVFSKKRRVPNTRWVDYLSAALPILRAGAETKLGDVLNPDSPLYRGFWEPFIIGALNTEIESASASLLRSVLIQSFGAGGKACAPMIPKVGLSESFVQPCLNVLRQYEVDLRTTHRLRSILWEGNQARELVFSNGNRVEMGPKDWLILALPAWFMRELLPEVSTPTEFRSILNAHFRVEGIEGRTGFTGVVGGYAEWIFLRDGVASVTLSCAERHAEIPTRAMAGLVWKEVAKFLDKDPETPPPHRIFLEKYATFAATPEQNLRRPSAYTGWDNVALAGEWTATGLPSTIEGALRSGIRAAQTVMRWAG